MGCTQSSVIEHNAMYCQYNIVYDPQTDPVLTYQVGAERKKQVHTKNNMHGGINQTLKQNGHKPEATCSGAITKAFENGMIDEPTKQYCQQVNKSGNAGNHYWGPKGAKPGKEVEGKPTALYPIFTYEVGPERQAKTDKKMNAHGGINQLLEKHGLEREDNFYCAIQVAYKNGLINRIQKVWYENINEKGNNGNHVWE